MRTFLKKNAFLAATAILAVAAAGCGSPGKTDVKSDRHLTVSFIPQQELLQDIAGNDFQITTLITPGVNPETYDPSISSLMALSKSRAYFRMNTPGFEESALTKISDNFSGLEVVDVSKGIQRIKGTHGGPHADGDPHFWSSVKNARVIASNMHAAMVRLYPGQKKKLDSNYAALDKKLVALDDSLSRILAECRGASFVMLHPSLSYFARDYGLHQIAIETDGKEVTPRQLAERIDAARRAGAKVMLHDREHSSDQARAISSQLGIPLMEISLNSENWESQLIETADAIASQCHN